MALTTWMCIFKSDMKTNKNLASIRDSFLHHICDASDFGVTKILTFCKRYEVVYFWGSPWDKVHTMSKAVIQRSFVDSNPKSMCLECSTYELENGIQIVIGNHSTELRVRLSIRRYAKIEHHSFHSFIAIHILSSMESTYELDVGWDNNRLV